MRAAPAARRRASSGSSFLCAANQSSDTVVTFRVNPATGRLRAQVVEIGSPLYIVFVGGELSWAKNSRRACQRQLLARWQRSSETDVPATTEQPHDQEDDKDNSEYPANAVTTTTGVIAAAVISEAAAEEEDKQNNYQD